MTQLCVMQFRIVQKALLVCFKEDKPTSPRCMPQLLEATYQEICRLSDGIQTADAQLGLAANKLACGTKLITMGLRCVLRVLFCGVQGFLSPPWPGGHCDGHAAHSSDLCDHIFRSDVTSQVLITEVQVPLFRPD